METEGLGIWSDTHSSQIAYQIEVRNFAKSSTESTQVLDPCTYADAIQTHNDVVCRYIGSVSDEEQQERRRGPDGYVVVLNVGFVRNDAFFPAFCLAQETIIGKRCCANIAQKMYDMDDDIMRKRNAAQPSLLDPPQGGETTDV